MYDEDRLLAWKELLEKEWRETWQPRWEANRKACLGGGAACLAALLLLFGWEDPATSAGSVAVPAEEAAGTGPGREEKPPGMAQAAMRIRGAERAMQGARLANPFSLLHETREEEERARQAPPAPDPAAAVPAPVHVIAAPAAAPPAPGGKGAADAPAPILQGIVSGEHGSMAILRCGDRTYALAAGETLDGKEIAEIGKRDVAFSDGTRLALEVDAQKAPQREKEESK